MLICALSDIFLASTSPLSLLQWCLKYAAVRIPSRVYFKTRKDHDFGTNLAMWSSTVLKNACKHTVPKGLHLIELMARDGQSPSGFFRFFFNAQELWFRLGSVTKEGVLIQGTSFRNQCVEDVEDVEDVEVRNPDLKSSHNFA